MRNLKSIMMKNVKKLLERLLELMIKFILNVKVHK